MPHLNELDEQYRDKGLTVLALTSEGAKRTEAWIEAKGAKFAYAYDRGGLAKQLKGLLQARVATWESCAACFQVERAASCSGESVARPRPAAAPRASCLGCLPAEKVGGDAALPQPQQVLTRAAFS